jgi:transposase
MLLSHQEDGMGRRGYPAEFRQRVLDLVAAGRRVREVAVDLGISDQTVHAWRRQERMDHGIEPGLTSAERAELAAARRRIRALETELRNVFRTRTQAVGNEGQGCAAWYVWHGTRRPDVEARDASSMRSYRRWTGVLA